MRLVTPTQTDRVAWAGTVEPLGETFKGDLPRPRVTPGEPAWWPAEQALESETGKKWTRPAGHRSYTLLRLACTLHPLSQSRAHYTEVTLAAGLRTHSEVGAVLAHDLYPQRLTADSTRTFTIGLGPDLKFAESFEASLADLRWYLEVFSTWPTGPDYERAERIEARLEDWSHAINHVLAGERDPDLTALPAELADRVREMLGG